MSIKMEGTLGYGLDVYEPTCTGPPSNATDVHAQPISVHLSLYACSIRHTYKDHKRPAAQE